MGVVTVRQLLLADAGTRVRDIMEDHVISVETAMDREEAAQLMSRYDLSALPVVDAEDRVVGIITFDDGQEELPDGDHPHQDPVVGDIAGVDGLLVHALPADALSPASCATPGPRPASRSTSSSTTPRTAPGPS